ncbi:hypothetical protein GCM10017562_03240 [Streptomyces roseofulvus]|uniref:FG-GAP repeat domain-containing protein n=1 Tax=Streptomyces roseofulvus TaxID=33902 RepID=UPI0031F87447
MTLVRTHHRRRHHRRHRLAAIAATVVLGVTGGAVSVLPAAAATPPGVQEGPQGTVVPFPADADVAGAGFSGFLSKTRGATPEFRWTRYADGSSLVLPGTYALGGGSDLVVSGDRSTQASARLVEVRDMARPDTAPLVIDLDTLGDGYYVVGLAGDHLLLARDENGNTVQYALTLDADVLAGGTPQPRKTAGGVQVDCWDSTGGWAGPRFALYDCWVADERMPAKIAVDLVTGQSSWYPQGDGEYAGAGAVSATHVAWRQTRVPGGAGIAVARPGSGTAYTWSPGGGHSSDPLYLVGDWLAYGQQAHIDTTARTGQPTVRPFTVQSIATGEKAVLLTAFSSAVSGPDGSLLVRGGTPDRGEGLYRISPRADGGRPDVALVASTGQATTVTATGTHVPATLTGEQVAGGVDLAWNLSRGDVRATLTLTHVASGARTFWSWDPAATAPRTLAWRWDGRDLGTETPGPARGGAYEWSLTAAPDEGIGPELRLSGRFTVNRPPAPHDFDGDGTADLFGREPGGLLRSFRSQPTAVGGPVRSLHWAQVGGGWQVYDRLETAGHVAGTVAPDVLARDTSGVLWLYQGTGNRDKPLSGRTRIGGGWQTYDRIAAGSDATGDGRPDLLATDRAGVLWLYPGTGNASAPFSARKRVGGGWGVYNEVAAVGNLAGGPAGDLLARDRSGVLWLYLGRGDGTFAARTRVGGGWGGFLDVVGVGDANGDGRADLMAAVTPTATAHGVTFYSGTGDWRSPLKPGVKTDVTSWTRYDSIF